ncbi:MAG: helix-turn-helix domain-containing protein [Eubacterium sp.]|nr:helix-turn-helix domain-containing protein [Eubacterium sp.]
MIRTLLIVDDEQKDIDKIKKIINSSEIKVEKIFECSNGKEAIDIINENDIDVMFTDVVMPDLNGIAMVKKLKEDKKLPLTCVISEHEDFEFAVDLFTNGVKQYVIKPINKKKIENLLKYCSEEMQKFYKTRKSVFQRVSYMMFYDNISPSEVISICDDAKPYLNFDEYIIFCLSAGDDTEDYTREDKYYFIKGEEFLDMIICDVKYKDEVINKIKNLYVGISTVCSNILDLKMAFCEAMEMRKTAFMVSEHIVDFSEFNQPVFEYEYGAKLMMHTANLICSNKMNEALKQLEVFMQGVKNHKYSIDEFQEQVRIIITTAMNIYKSMLGDKENEVKEILDMYRFQNLDEYMEVLRQWVDRFDELVNNDADEHMTIKKMNDAVEYIKANYNKDLNMAVVSNHISMNYSLFSYTFKRYVGTNFVNYLKNIRIGEAKKLLVETDMKVHEISKAVGYEHEKHFMKTFKNITGLTPSQYRKNLT